MPFTGSHPAAVLPLVRCGLPPSALVIGSMVPDLPYYAPLPVDAGLTHTLTGAVGVDLLLGAAVFAVWQALIGPAIVSATPPLQRRLPEAAHAGLGRHLSGVRRVLSVAVALVFGALTHVCWDAFTHPNKWGTAHVPWLRELHGPLPGYAWAQYASGVFGAVVLAMWCVRWWRTTPAVPGPHAGLRPAPAWALVGLAGVLGGAYGAWSVAGQPLRRVLFAGATRGGTGAGAALLALAVYWYAVVRPRPRA